MAQAEECGFGSTQRCMQRATATAGQAVVAGCDPGGAAFRLQASYTQSMVYAGTGFCEEASLYSTPGSYLGVRSHRGCSVYTGSHSLDVEACRQGHRKIARSLQQCSCCDMGKAEDEMH
jgi:hypothetical protein